MMTKEEVASIVLHCTEQKVSFKSRLEELGIAQWRFYEAKGRYEKAKDACSPNELLELGDKGTFIACPTLTRKAKKASAFQSESNCNLNIVTIRRTAFLIDIYALYLCPQKCLCGI